jgi:hypothetical protein
MIDRWKELYPDADVRDLKTIDDLPDADEPAEPKNFT